MQKPIHLLFVLSLPLLALTAHAAPLACRVSFLTTPVKGKDTVLHNPQRHPISKFFRFIIEDGDQTALLEHQNRCVTGEDIRDRRLKGILCLFVTSGAKLTAEPGTVPSEDDYLKNSNRVVTFQVYHQTAGGGPTKFYLQYLSEMESPIRTFRGSFQGAGGGLSSLTVTCLEEEVAPG